MMGEKNLYEALAVCRSPVEVQTFIKDLLSVDEINRAEKRWSIAFMHLQDPSKFSQSELKRLGLGSSDKIGRIIRPAKLKESGYKLIYDRLLENHKKNNGEEK